MSLDTLLEEIVNRAISREVTPIKEEIADILELLPTHTDTAGACKYLKVSESTLEAYRKDPNRIIEFTQEGGKCGKYTYCVRSLMAHKKAKTVRRANRLKIAS